MSRTGTPNDPFTDADPRVPFPRTDEKLSCQTEPKLFAIQDITDRAGREKALAKARLACSGCPIVKGCLQWALANKQLTPTGVWAATTARQRTTLRKDLVRRLGDDLVGVVAEQARRKKEKQRAARTASSTVREQVMARLELELLISWPVRVRAVARADVPGPAGAEPRDPRSSPEGGGMTFTNPPVLDGFLDEPTVPATPPDRPRGSASPSPPRTHGADEIVLPCSVADPMMAHAVLHDLAPGDQLRVTGYLHLPRTPTGPMFMVVTELRVLQAALLLDDPASCALRLIAINHT